MELQQLFYSLQKVNSIISNGGYNIRPTLIKRSSIKNKKERIIKKGVSQKINPILRKIVSTKEGTANFANIEGYKLEERQELLKNQLMEFIQKIKLILLLQFFQHQNQSMF